MRFTVVSTDMDNFTMQDMQHQRRYNLLNKKLELAVKNEDLEAEIEITEQQINAFDILLEMLDRIAVVHNEEGEVVKAVNLPPVVVTSIMEKIAEDAEEAVDPKD